MPYLDRRAALKRLISFVAASPVIARAAEEAEDDRYPPSYADEVMGPINLHEFEDVAKSKLHKMAYDFIAGGVEDELTLRANRESFDCLRIMPRYMVDVTNIDTSVELLGRKMNYPIALAPTGGKNLIVPGADLICARGAAKVQALYSVGGAPMDRLLDEGVDLRWWRNTTGSRDQESTQNFARRAEDDGAEAIVLTVDNPYQSNRDRNNRNRFDYGYMSSGVPGSAEGGEPRNPAVAAMWLPHTPNLKWDYIEWVRQVSEIPVVVKGILDPYDGEAAVQHGAAAVIVSNHGARQLGSAMASIDALPDVVQAVSGKIPVMMDGGIRRGTDVLKALGLGATCVQIGRPYLWGMAAFGQDGVSRVVELLQAEFKLAMALSGQTKASTIDRRIVRNPACGL